MPIPPDDDDYDIPRAMDDEMMHKDKVRHRVSDGWDW